MGTTDLENFIDKSRLVRPTIISPGETPSLLIGPLVDASVSHINITVVCTSAIGHPDVVTVIN